MRLALPAQDNDQEWCVMTDLASVAIELVSLGRGILAADESIGTMSARLEAQGISASPEARRDYREMLVSSPGLSGTVSGVILCPETFEQTTTAGVPFPEACREAGILPGIKVDTGTSLLPGAGGATITEGLDLLGKRLAGYASAGAAFAKWRAVITIGVSDAWAIEANAHALTRYAELCQEHGVVPIVEPEVLAAGTHDVQACASTTERTLDAVFSQLSRANVDLTGVVLKPNMVTPGLDTGATDHQQTAATTLAVLNAHVPREVPGITFLSGGHSNTDACASLAAINELAGSTAPWRLTFSFGRALVSDALQAWGGKAPRATAAQLVLLANCARAAAATRPAGTEPAVLALA